MKIKTYLFCFIVTSFIFPIILNSELIEFNNKFCTPDNYKPYTGDVQEFYVKNNTLKFEGSYVDGLKNGQFIFYFENGNVYKRENYLDGKPHGEWTEFDKNNNLLFKKVFIDNGFIFTSFYENLKIKNSGKFINDFMDGKWVEYYENGLKKTEHFYINGIIDSSKTKIYEDILLSEEIMQIETSREYHIEENDSLIDNQNNEIRDGEHIIYSEKNKPKIREFYLNNKLDGEWLSYYDSGRIFIKRFYANGRLDSSKETIKFYENGALMNKFQEKIIDDSIIKTGPFISYYLDGSKKDIGEFSNNYKVGEWKRYYQTGELFSIINYDLTLHSIYSYYKNGNLFYSCSLLNDSQILFHGEFNSFYSTGEIKEKGNYINNIKDGSWHSYYKSGNVLSKINYVEGHGIYSKYYDSGEILEDGYYQNNKKEGTLTSYFKNGNKQQVVYYINGKIDVNKLCYLFNDKGNLIAEKFIKDNDGKLINDGLYIGFYDNGSIKEKGIYVNDLKDGNWNEYYDNGSILSEINFINGDGLYTSFYLTGEVLSKGNYINNKKHGKWTKYYKDGNKSWEYYFYNDSLNPNKICYNWHETGYKKSEGYLVLLDEQTIWDGKYIEYYENGVIYLEGKYSNGFKQGLWKQYYNNRLINSTKYFKNGNPSGKWTFYNENGDIVKVDNY